MVGTVTRMNVTLVKIELKLLELQEKSPCFAIQQVRKKIFLQCSTNKISLQNIANNNGFNVHICVSCEYGTGERCYNG